MPENSTTPSGLFNAWLTSMEQTASNPDNWNYPEGHANFLDDFIAPSFGYDYNED